MKIKYSLMALVAICTLVSCNSHKGTGVHSHNGEASHSHSHQEKITTHKANNYFGAYVLDDEKYGTKTYVTIKDGKRVMVTNSLPDHKTGAYPQKGNPNTISAQNKTYTFPLNPKYTGKSQWIREPGIALNGIKFEPGTAEVVVCDTGENYRVEALQDVINLGLDFNHAHVQPTGAYHYHGTPTSVIENFDVGEDLVHVGFAHDGFPMYYSKSGKYKPSFKLLDGNRAGEDCTYSNPKNTIDISVNGHHDGIFGSDFEYVEGLGDLDECNGITLNGEYMYMVTNEFPYIGRCLMGEFETEERKGPPQGEQGRGRGSEDRPTAEHLMERMDVNKDGKLSKQEVKGPLAEQFSKIDANSDGFITKQELDKGRKSRG